MHSTTDNYNTLLNDACYKGDIEKVRELLKLTAIRPTLQLITKDKDHFEKVNELLSQSPAIDNTHKNGTAGLVITSNQSNLEELVHKLVSLGVEIDAPFGCELLIASEHGHLEVVRELLAHGAKVDTADNDNCTPLYFASEYGYLEVVRELLARGAAVDTANNDGKTPLYIASEKGRLEVVRELLAKGAKVDTANRYGKTPLYIASKKGYWDVVEELEAAMKTSKKT